MVVSYIYNTSPVKPSALGLTVSNSFWSISLLMAEFYCKKVDAKCRRILSFIHSNWYCRNITFLFLDDISSLPSYISTIGLAVAGFFGVFVGLYFYFEAHNLLPISFLNIFMLLEAVVVVSGEMMIFFPFVPFSWTKKASSYLLTTLHIPWQLGKRECYAKVSLSFTNGNIIMYFTAGINLARACKPCLRVYHILFPLCNPSGQTTYGKHNCKHICGNTKGTQ